MLVETQRVALPSAASPDLPVSYSKVEVHNYYFIGRCITLSLPKFKIRVASVYTLTCVLEIQCSGRSVKPSTQLMIKGLPVIPLISGTLRQPFGGSGEILHGFLTGYVPLVLRLFGGSSLG